MKTVKLLIKCHITLRLHITSQIVSCQSHAHSLSDRSTGLKHAWKKIPTAKQTNKKPSAVKFANFPLNPLLLDNTVQGTQYYLKIIFKTAIYKMEGRKGAKTSLCWLCRWQINNWAVRIWRYGFFFFLLGLWRMENVTLKTNVAAFLQ